MSNIVWSPQPRQFEFMRRPEYEALYGGAAGGGKSDALVAEALRQVDIPHYKAILFRKTFPEARELIIKSLNMYPRAYPKAKYNGSEHCWIFPSKARIYFGSMPNSNSYLRYQGLSFAFIGFDELTHFTQEEYEYLISRNRADGAGVRVYIRSTANPGGVGHGWVKERFITAMPPNTPYEFKTTVTAPDGKQIEVRRKRIYIPAKVFDNKILLKNDPNYIANLAMLPEAERNALLYGSWDSFSGMVYKEWKDNPDGYSTRQWTHVIAPFDIPRHWRRYRSFDFGYTRPFAVQWWAVDTDGIVYLYRELYGYTGTPNEGVRWEPSKIAAEIRKIEDEQEKGNHIIGIADPSIWDESRGADGTIINLMEREGVYFDKGKNDRISGKMQMHYRLQFSDKGFPMMYVFNTCRNFIRTIPNLVYDTVKVEDVDTSTEDHSYDAARYFLMEFPVASKPPAPPKKIYMYNPLA